MLLFLVFLAAGTITNFGIGGEGVIILDAGHGGNDPGAMYGGVNEKDINLTVTEKTAEILLREGYQVVMTRGTDDFVELSERAGISNRRRGALFVSIHCNASENLQTYGLETYCARGSEEGRDLAEILYREIRKTTDAEKRGVFERDFVVLKETRCPAALVEIGFLSNAAERQKLQEEGYQKKIAEGIAKGIKEALK